VDLELCSEQALEEETGSGMTPDVAGFLPNRFRNLDRYVKKDPMDMMPIGKNLYSQVLGDEYSGLPVSYPMQKKLDSLKCENDKEFMSSEFKEYHST
jgi:hypothetical protein